MSEEKLFLEVIETNKVILSSSKPWTKLYFHVEEIVIQCGKLQLKLPQFWDLNDIEEIVFEFEDSEHHYKRVKTYKRVKE
jgi:hypothetical protein